MTPQELLTQLENVQALLDLLTSSKQEAIDAATTPEVRAAWAEIEDEWGPQVFAAAADVAAATEAVKVAVAEHGETVKGRFLQAVYGKGRITWDAKSLDGYAVAHPELLGFRKEGQPSISIRSIK